MKFDPCSIGYDGRKLTAHNVLVRPDFADVGMTCWWTLAELDKYFGKDAAMFSVMALASLTKHEKIVFSKEFAPTLQTDAYVIEFNIPLLRRLLPIPVKIRGYYYHPERGWQYWIARVNPLTRKITIERVK